MKELAENKLTTRQAAIALLLATVFWGCGFTWAKAAGEAVQSAAGLPPRAAFGPIFILAWRFLIAGIVWLLIFPGARSGWTAKGLMRSFLVGVLLAIGLIVQHIGLDRTSEAVSAFLTSLTILFVPILTTFALRRPPRPVLWIGVVMATAGVWLMTGAQPSGFGWGEILGLACSFTFSLYILAVNAAAKHETPWRLTAGQFLTVGIVCAAICPLLPGGLPAIRPKAALHILAIGTVWKNVLLLSSFTTLGAFGLLTHFQPRLDPTRAALIYLFEPVIAAAFAAMVVGHRMEAVAVGGAALIICANVLVEMVNSRFPASDEAPVVLVD